MALAPVVLDNGTGSIKCGCAGVSPLPLLVCPTVVGRPKVDAFTLHNLLCSSDPSSQNTTLTSVQRNESTSCSAHTNSSIDRVHRAQLLQREVLCGDELAGLRGTTALTYPIRNGVIHNMDAMQELWDYVLCQRLPHLLNTNAAAAPRNSTTKSASHSQEVEVGHSEERVTSDDGLAWLAGRPLLVTGPPNISTKQRCDVMELFFEEYRFRAIQSTPQGILTLFANGVERGVVVECGEGVTHCTPVFDGFVLGTAQRRVDLGGRAVTEYLTRLLQGHPPSSKARGGLASASRRGISPCSAYGGMGNSTSTDDGVFRRLKERYCYVSVDQSLDQRLAHDTNALQRTCTLPDGAQCTLAAERFVAPEVLFSPFLMDVESPGVSAMLWDAVEAADVDVRRALYENIVLSGGSTLLPGFGARLAKDVKSLYLTEKLKGDVSRMPRCPIQVKEPPRRQYMAFMGGTLVAELSAEQPEMWMSRAEYEEGGTSAIIARYGPQG